MKKVERKVVPVDSVKACSGGRGTAPLINLGIRRSLVAKFTSGRSKSGKGPRYPLNRTLSGSQSRLGPFRGKENILLLQGLEPQTVQSMANSLFSIKI